MRPSPPTYRLIHDAGDWSLGRWRCTGHDHDEATEVAHRHEVVIPVRGGYLREREGREVLASPNRAVLADRGDSYTVRHPLAGGDECLVLLLGDRALEDLGRVTHAVNGVSRPRFRQVEAAVTGSVFLRAARLLRAGDADPLMVEAEAAALLDGLLDRGSRASGSRASGSRTTAAEAPASATTAARHRRAVARGAAFISAHYRSPISLEDIASAAAYSPFHFARVFRRVMGIPPHRYVVRLRLRDALSQVLDGATDLTALALRTGFASHSHMTEAFRAEYGQTPSRIRASSR